MATRRSFTLKVERLGADGGWQSDGSVIAVDVSSMDELRAELRCPSTTVVSNFDAFENDWVPVTDLGDMPARARLRVGESGRLPWSVITTNTNCGKLATLLRILPETELPSPSA